MLAEIVVSKRGPLLIWSWDLENIDYRKVASSNMSRLEAHAGSFRMLMGIFDPYILWHFAKKLIFWLITCSSTHHFVKFRLIE
jgi:hypothetical protein